MSLNLKPGQILQGSIYQPPPPPHRPPFPLERAAATYPPDHYLRPPHANMYSVPGGEGDPTAGGSPLRRNQTLPAPAQGRYTPGPAYHIPPPTPQVQPMSERRPHEPPVSQRGSHRGYTDEPRGRQLLPDQEPPHSHHRGHRDPPALARNGTEPYPNRGRRDSRLEPAPQPTSSQSQLPPQIQPQTSHREERRPSPFRPEQLYEIHTPPERDTPPDSRPDSFFAGPPPPSSRPPQQTSRHSPPSSRPPPAASRPPPSQHTPTPPRSTAQAPPQDQQARRYEPPSQTLASMQNQPPSPDIHLPPPSIMSSSTQSGLAPSHVPRRLVMPTPLAPSPERNAPSDPRARPQPDNRIRFTDNARGNGAQHQHHPKASTIPMQQAGARNMLRKRSATVAPPLHAPVSAPAPVQSGGLLAFFGLGKGSKPQVREMRIPEPRAVNGVREKETRETREKETARRLSKRR
ncbi:hypothetical protein BV25DRAFT_1390964 [Artomyces pyxidatus]|uniref:Uncharacterized protein n=1 Tax=Artomyces pyxidatus TaxID=48021 RepID=A0ACB8TDJ1_9AGAM|nr:hypothetical protein BV25DRAFT_1390964 [Artomyces pyxidatus]